LLDKLSDSTRADQGENLVRENVRLRDALYFAAVFAIFQSEDTVRMTRLLQMGGAINKIGARRRTAGIPC